MFKKLAKLSVVMTFGEMTLRVARLFTFICLAQFYDPALFGILNYATNFLLIFYVVGELGINQFITAQQSKIDAFPDKNLLSLAIAKQIFLIFMMSFGFAVIVILSGFHIDRISLVAYLLIIADANLMLYFTFLRAKHLVKQEIYFKFAQAAIYLIPSLVLYLIHIEFDSFMFLLASLNMILSIYAIKMLIKDRFFDLTFDTVGIQIKKYLHDILPLFLTAIFTTIYFKADTIFIEHMLGAYTNGVYGVATKFLEAAMILPWMVNTIMTPLIARREVGFLKNLTLQLIIGMFSFAFLYILSSYVILHLISSHYENSINLIKILSFSIIFMSINSFLFTYILSLEKLWINTGVSFLMMIFNLAANYYFIPLYQINSSAVITVLTEALGTILIVIAVLKIKFNKAHQ